MRYNSLSLYRLRTKEFGGKELVEVLAERIAKETNISQNLAESFLRQSWVLLGINWKLILDQVTVLRVMSSRSLHFSWIMMFSSMGLITQNR